MTEHQAHLRKGLLPTLAAIALLGLVYAGLLIKSDYELRHAEIARSLDDQANRALESVDKFFARYESVLASVAQSSCIREHLAEQCDEFLPRLLREFPEVVNFAATQRDGTIFASARPINRQKPPNAAHLPFFKALTGGGAYYIMDPHQGPVSGETITGIAIPVRDARGSFDGVLGVTVKFAELSRLWQSRDPLSPIGLVIVDRNQQVIFGSGIAAGQNNTLAATLAPVLNAENAGRVTIDGTRYLTHTDFFQRGDWKIVTLTPVTFGLREYLSGNLLVLALILPLVLLGMLGALIYVREQRAISALEASEERLRAEHELLESRVAQRTRELAASEEAHRNILATSLDGFWQLSREGVLLDVNPSYARQSGYSRAELIGRRVTDLEAREDIEQTAAHIRRVMANGSDLFETSHRRKDGSVWEVEIATSYSAADGGRFFVFLRDISARKQAEHQLLDQQTHMEALVQTRTADLMLALEAARSADQAKDTFIANVSHELRTPLNAVIGLSELARRISTDPRQQDYLDKVTGAGKSLAAVINDLLDLSKISAGHLEFEAITFSLHNLVLRSRSVMAHRASENGLELVEHIDAAVPDVLVGDPMRIEQILLNLLSNAIKFTPAGRVELRIGLHATEANRVCLNIEVEDTGIGLAAASIARLFQPFAQADESMNRRFGGTGLGLALCKRLAERMGGDISVSSHEGTGTTFRVRLWLERGKPADLEPDKQAADNTLPTRYQDAQVLVVEDQALNRELVEGLLDEVGIVPHIACNGQEAIDVLRQAGPSAFDLVLMDIQMPLMDGLTATRKIRGWPGFGELPIVAMTAHTMEHEKEISTAAGMNDHIGKPFETTSFYGLLARWIPVAKQQMPSASSLAAPKPSAKAGLASLHSIDIAAGLARFAGNEPRYRHWLMEFLNEAPEYAAQLRQTLAAGQAEAARQSIHAIKGRVGMLGMSRLQLLAAALEAALMQGTPTNDLIDRLHTEVGLLCAEIRSGLDSTAPTPPTLPSPQVIETPPGTTPDSIAQLFVMLKCSDGSSEQAIDRCLTELKDTHWAPRLHQALAHVRHFDFDAAHKVLTPDDPGLGKGN